MTSDLSPERLSVLLADAPLGQPFRYHETTGSTNDDAKAWAREDAPHGALVVAETQTKGRGRLGRAWEGGSGQSLLTSFVLRPSLISRPSLAPEGFGLLGGAVAVALAKTVRERTGLPARTKWPNDLWIGERKAAGILLEADWRGERLASVVAGIGLNVNQREADLPPVPRTPAASLMSECGHAHDRGELLRALCFALHETLGCLAARPDRLLEEWHRLELTLGRMIEAQTGEETFAGTVTGLLPDGSLRLLTEGRERRLKAHEVTLRSLR